jgi:hypothetical protein
VIAFWSIVVRLAFLPFVVVGLLVIGLGALVVGTGVQAIRFLTGDRC